MSNYRKHIDQFFREKLGNYRETPPPDVWDSLEGRLDGLIPGAPGVPSYRWLWHTAIVAIIVVLGISVGKKIIMPANDDQTALNVSSSKATTSNTTATEVNNTAPANANSNTGGDNNGNNNTNNSAAGTVTTPENAGGNQQQHNGQQSKPARNTTTTNNDKHGQQTNKGKHTPPSNIYNSKPEPTALNNNERALSNNHLSNPSPEETNENDQVVNASPNTTLSVVDKHEPAQQTANGNKPKAQPQQDASKNKPKPSFPRLEAGVKLGFEWGFNSGASQKAVVSPYLQYNLSPKVAIMTQPGIKAANAPNRNAGSPQQYYQVNEGGKVTQNTTPVTAIVGGSLDTISYTTVYTYSESHDSIVKKNTTGGSYMEFELPVLLKYNLTKKLSVYGGVNMVYSKMTSITESTQRTNDINRSYSQTISTPNMPTAADQPAMGFNYAGTAYANYGGPLKANESGSKMRAGYMIGFSYAYHQKWLIDGLMEQSPVKTDVKGGYDINTPLSSPYFRFSIGYKLTK